MAYAAVVSVAQILDQLLNTDRYSVNYPNPEIQYLYSKVCSLQSSLDKNSPAPISKRSEVLKLEIRIRDVMYRAQDMIELFISRQICSPDSDGDDDSASLFLQNLGEITAELDLITESAEEIGGNKRNGETSSLLLKNAPPPKPNPLRKSTRIVGLENDGQRLKEELLDSTAKLQVFSITGSPGTGKTTLARFVYDDADIQNHFIIRVWVTVSQDYNIGKILSSMLSSMDGSWSEGSDDQYTSDQLRFLLRRSLLNKLYLIVMDDIWDTSVFDEVRNLFPDNVNGSRIVITSRDENVAFHARSSYFHHVMRPLDEENSWILLCQHVFEGGNCPPHLKEVGRKIAEKCGGNLLSIVVVGGLLSQKPKTEFFWESVEADVHGAAAISEDSYMEIFTLSYDNLPGRLKPCFLYMAAFPEDSEILVSKLINFWVAEGFLTKPLPSSRHQNLEKVAKQHLEDLIYRNLISIHKMSSDGQPKTCSLQGNLRQVAMQECDKEKFFHAIKRYPQQLPEGTKTQRRISIHDNILLCSEDVYECIKTIEAARTLVYAGPDHHHPLPLFLTFELLRVVDALSVYFIELPDALFELIHLRYLGFTCDEDLPSSISKLQNLLTLIVRQHHKIMLRRISTLPVEIWNMPQIRHLLIKDWFLPDCSVALNSVVFFENLQSLSNVNAACCTREILQKMPNLKKLCTWVEGPGVVQFDLDQLQHLEIFKFTILKPIPGRKIDFHPKLAFPSTLRKLSLSGCGIPWEDMKVIADLPGLQVLKLREFAFHGPEWQPNYVFEKLKFLLLESLNLVFWNTMDSNFPVLESLKIRHCYQLEEISSDIGYIGGLELIELVDCGPSAVESVEDIKQEQEGFDNRRLQVRILSSWE